jgi:hypothetical protein
MQIGLSIRPMLCRWTLSSYESHQNLQFRSRQPQYLVKPGLGFFSHILDKRQAVSKLHDLSNHTRSLRLPLEGANGRQGFGPTKTELDPAIARPPHSHGYHSVQEPTPVEGVYLKVYFLSSA